MEDYVVVELDFDEVITLEQIMDQSTIDCVILAATYGIIHLVAAIQTRKNYRKGIRK